MVCLQIQTEWGHMWLCGPDAEFYISYGATTYKVYFHKWAGPDFFRWDGTPFYPGEFHPIWDVFYEWYEGYRDV